MVPYITVDKGVFVKSVKEIPGARYPHSANLFIFCRRVLDHRHGGGRVIDQDVGQLLGFDPADCSHWKKGKKHIRSIQAMKDIAKHLAIDERLVIDVASGDLDALEGYCEYTGYGSFEPDPKLLETSRRELQQKHKNLWTRDREETLKDQYKIDVDTILRCVQEIQRKIRFEEAPLYLPEITACYPDIMFKPMDWAFEVKTLPTELVQKTQQGNKLLLQYKNNQEHRPFVRFRLAKAMASYFLPQNSLPEDALLSSWLEHLHDIESNIFAAHLLVPTELLQKELKKVDLSKDIVQQLAETFWVSKQLMNKRLKDLSN